MRAELIEHNIETDIFILQETYYLISTISTFLWRKLHFFGIRFLKKIEKLGLKSIYFLEISTMVTTQFLTTQHSIRSDELFNFDFRD
jgi:hypothetical protein